MRWMLASALAVSLAVGLVGPGSARQEIQADLLVQSGDGALWLVRDGQRHALAPQPASAEDLARWTEGLPYGGQIPPLVLAERATSSAGTPTLGGSPPDVQGEWHRVARWQGNGDKNTEPFTIQGSQWRITYTVRDPRSNTPRVCIVVRNLETAHVDGGCYRQDGVTYVYRRGTFYLDITSADQWTAAVEDYY